MCLVRQANLGDLYQLMDIAEAMHHESPRYSALEFSKEKMQALYIKLIEQDNCLMLVADKDGEVVGGLGGAISEGWFTTDLIASEFGVFLIPEHRGGITAARMIKQFIDWAKWNGAKMINLGISTGIHTEETAKLYRSLGLKQCSIGFEV